MTRRFALLALSALFFMPIGEADAKRKRGIAGQAAPELDVQEWMNTDASFSVGANEGKVVYLFFFQSWCPGCSSHGFPTLQAVYDAYKDDERVSFAIVQTVFEGYSFNTTEKGLEKIEEFGLTDIPFAQSVGEDDSRSPVMSDYRSGGTPWTVIIGPDGVVAFDGFSIGETTAIETVEGLLESVE